MRDLSVGIMVLLNFLWALGRSIKDPGRSEEEYSSFSFAVSTCAIIRLNGDLSCPYECLVFQI